ncbi:MAG: hypothetical protein RQ743_12940, partial [Bacteroidales bacterium]|nr:hypothetical protein [Bacteroidales bacterium]
MNFRKFLKQWLGYSRRERTGSIVLLLILLVVLVIRMAGGGRDGREAEAEKFAYDSSITAEINEVDTEVPTRGITSPSPPWFSRAHPDTPGFGSEGDPAYSNETTTHRSSSKGDPAYNKETTTHRPSSEVDPAPNNEKTSHWPPSKGDPARTRSEINR